MNAPAPKDMKYENKLRKIGFTVSDGRRKRGDMDMLYNHVTGRVNLDKDDIEQYPTHVWDVYASI